MSTVRQIPTTADIYLEADGKKLAVVQSYKVVASRSSKAIQAFGQEEPVTTIRGATHYELELTRIYATDAAIRDNVDFFALDGFNLVICKPGKNIIYSDCRWKQIQESAEVGGTVLEKVTIAATKRLEMTK